MFGQFKSIDSGIGGESVIGDLFILCLLSIVLPDSYLVVTPCTFVGSKGRL